MNQTLRRRRRRQENKIKFVAGLLLAAILLIFIYSIVLSSSSIQGEVDISGKGYITLTVHSNDTLWSIADTYMNKDYYTFEAFIKEVEVMNHIEDAEIYAGEQILIPVIASN